MELLHGPSNRSLQRNFLVTLVFFVLIVIRGGDVVRSAALNKFPSVRFVTDNGLSHGDDYYKSVQRIDKQSIENENNGVISDDIFWGPLVESAYPRGFAPENYTAWNSYVNNDRTRIVALEQDKCGRMQNRLITFADGTIACGRYRQNIDQIQGELFSFYLGQLLKLTNMAPTALHFVEEGPGLWANASAAVLEASWKAQRPVVLTKHISGLVPAGIPTTFQKLERHLNKFDVTLGLDGMKNSISEDEQVDGNGAADTAAATADVVGVRNLLADRATLSSASSPAVSSSKIWPSINWFNIKSSRDAHPPLGNLIELAQWSDLVVFDYLIAHLDRMVNNLYNFQWNSEIMAAPAHNLAKEPKSELLLFLDNESGLLHGYRLLAKYQAYHSLLLENLCVFRRSTIDQVRVIACAVWSLPRRSLDEKRVNKLRVSRAVIKLQLNYFYFSCNYSYAGWRDKMWASC